MTWKAGRGALGPFQPLLGSWRTIDAPGSGAHGMDCSREFTAFGKGWLRLEAEWRMGDRPPYRETAFYGKADDGRLAFHSFTNDGKRSTGRLIAAPDVHADAIAFEAQMPAGLARMLYWPREDGETGFRFAVESRTKSGWNRFMTQTFGPSPD